MPELSRVSASLAGKRCRSLSLSTFKGVDLTSGAASVDPTRSPEAPNMMPDANGFPVKRPGYRLRAELDGCIWGVYSLTEGEETHRLIHAGTTLYLQLKGQGSFQPIVRDMASAPSMGFQLGQTLWLLDGKTYRYCRRQGQNFCCEPVSKIATVPTITVSKGPTQDGPATSYDPLNLLTGFRTESYLGTADTRDYYLSFEGLSPSPVSVQVLDGAGQWQTWEENKNFSVNRQTGLVQFFTAPGAPPVTGEDNVKITYEVVNEQALAGVNHCRFGILYGVNGAMDRIFMSGDKEHPHIDRYSAYNDPAFIGDTFYSVLGSETSPIMGYSVLGNSLITHKKGEENDRNAFVRVGELDQNGDAVFRVTHVIQGDGAVSERCYATLSSEPVFLSSRGVFALTANDLTGERYEQKRSFYIDGALKGADLSRASATLWGRFYALAAGGRIYLLDSDQKSYENQYSASTFQYECYYWPDIPVSVIWSSGEELWFGDETGYLFCFDPADGVGVHYADWCANGEKPVEAWWSTPMLALSGYGTGKNVQDVVVTAQPYGRSGGEIYYASDRWFEKCVKSYHENIFDWYDLSFEDFSFNCLDRPVAVRCARHAPRVQQFQVKVKNRSERQPFGVYAIRIDYQEAGKIRVEG